MAAGRRTGSADLPLHGGRVPPWLGERMTVLGRLITETIVHHYGREEFLRRLAHPFWFQSFGAVMGMDWHSSGITTSVMGALKRGLAPLQGELGIYVCGGRGRHSRKTPHELIAIGERTGIDGNALARASRLTAKVDSAAVQDGFELYLHSFVLLDRLEAWDADHGKGQAWEAQAWIGGDLSRLWLRSEGERVDGHTESADLEVLYGRSVSAWWDVVGGIRHDFQPGSPQTWAAIGLQGLAPYKFEVQATAYLGESGQTAADIEVEYELLLTNRLILQPLVELEWHGKDDPQRGIGSGLGKVEAGLRLRYEFTRRFAPYVGVVYERAFGGTADLHEAAGEDTRDTRVVAGLRLWF